MLTLFALQFVKKQTQKNRRNKLLLISKETVCFTLQFKNGNTVIADTIAPL